MSTPTPTTPTPATPGKSMDAIMALCKRRGFVYQASDIYGGINGFWDYGPLGAQLKKNLREAWWQDMIMNPCWGRKGPGGERVRCVPVETCIIQHPKVWEASGHLAGFADPMRKCPGCGHFVRADQLWDVLVSTSEWFNSLIQEFEPAPAGTQTPGVNSVSLLKWARGKGKRLAPNLALVRSPEVTLSWLATRVNGQPSTPPDVIEIVRHLATEQLDATGLQDPCPRCGGVLGAPAAFKLMFETYAGIIQTDDNKVYLRPETAQGVFLHFKNVVDSTRVKIPFGIGNTGRSFRNEITPRNFTFRSREFEQAESAPAMSSTASPSPPPASASSKGSPTGATTTSPSIRPTARSNSTTSTPPGARRSPTAARRANATCPTASSPPPGLTVVRLR